MVEKRKPRNASTDFRRIYLRFPGKFCGIRIPFILIKCKRTHLMTWKYLTVVVHVLLKVLLSIIFLQLSISLFSLILCFFNPLDWNTILLHGYASRFFK